MPTKELIAQIQSTKNGKLSSIHAVMKKLKLIQKTLKMIFVILMLIADQAFAVVLLLHMMKMVSNWENSTSVTTRCLLNGWTIWTIKHSTHSNAWFLQVLSKSEPQLLQLPLCFI